jgi:hypothetical protein
MKCVDSFISCVLRMEEKPKIKEMPKVMAQVFLSSKPGIVNCVGLGAQRNYWDFNSSKLKDLKTFIEKI